MNTSIRPPQISPFSSASASLKSYRATPAFLERMLSRAFPAASFS